MNEEQLTFALLAKEPFYILAEYNITKTNKQKFFSMLYWDSYDSLIASMTHKDVYAINVKYGTGFFLDRKCIMVTESFIITNSTEIFLTKAELDAYYKEHHYVR